MAKVHFKTTDGRIILVEATEGSLMEAAVEAAVPGIDGDCGGVGSCSTCHIHVDPDWIERTGPADEMERDTLEFNVEPTRCSRLSCQIEVTEDLDGLIVSIPSNS